MCSVSIVLPLFKPRGMYVQQLIHNINYLKSHLPEDVYVHYIVVHDDIEDQTVISAFKLISDELTNISYICNQRNRGKGYALREGVRQTRTRYVITMDYDFPYKMENIADLIEVLRFSSYDIIVGRRSSRYFKCIPLKRKIISKFLSLLNFTFLKLPINDTQSGLKGFNEKGKEVFLQTSIKRFLVDTEFVLRGAMQGLSIKEINIELRPNVTFSNFDIKIVITELLNFLKLLYLSKSLSITRGASGKSEVKKAYIH